MRYLNRQTFVRGLAVLLGVRVWSASAQPVVAGRFLVQVWFDNGSVVATEGEDLGRVEVSSADGRFIGCVLASSVRTQFGETFVTPVSVGFTTDVDPGVVKVVVEGEMLRLGTVKTKTSKVI